MTLFRLLALPEAIRNIATALHGQVRALCTCAGRLSFFYALGVATSEVKSFLENSCEGWAANVFVLELGSVVCMFLETVSEPPFVIYPNAGSAHQILIAVLLEFAVEKASLIP